MGKITRRKAPQLLTGLKPPDRRQVEAHYLYRLAFLEKVAQDKQIHGANWIFELAYSACVELYGTSKERGRRPSITKDQLAGPGEIWTKMREKGYSPSQISQAFVYVEPFYTDNLCRKRDPDTRKTALSGAPDRIRKVFKKYGYS